MNYKQLFIPLAGTLLLASGCSKSSGGGGDSGTPTTYYTIGGTVSGLAEGTTLTLLNNGSDELNVTAEGGFSFLEQLEENSDYNVSIKNLTDSQGEPTLQHCELTSGNGTAISTVDTIDITCDKEYFFSAYDGVSYGFWKTDGSEANTLMIKEYDDYAALESNQESASMDGVLYFVGHDTLHGYELWKTDGTEAGTVLLKEINTATGHAF